MTYIKLLDVQKILYWTYPTISIEIWKINSLPSINPEAMIEQMIEKEEKKNNYTKKDDYTIWFIHWLKASKELLQKFKS